MLNTLFRNKKIEAIAALLLFTACLVSFMLLDGRDATMYSPETISVFGLMIAAYHLITLYILTPIKILTETILLCATGTHVLLAFEHIATHHYIIASVMVALGVLNFGMILWRELRWKR